MEKFKYRFILISNMIIEREIGEKGQLVIPKDIRRFLGLKKGQKVIFEVRKDEVVLRPEQDPEKFLEDFLNIPKTKNITLKEIKRGLEEKYDLP